MEKLRVQREESEKTLTLTFELFLTQMLRARALPRSIRSTRASATASRRGYTDTAAHNASILDQFTRQAVPFSQAAGITSEESLTRIIEFSGVGADDTLLDVAYVLSSRANEIYFCPLRSIFRSLSPGI